MSHATETRALRRHNPAESDDTVPYLGLNFTQIELVRSTWAMVHPVRHVAAELFYARLFEQQPELRALFKGDLSRQGTMLMAALGGVVANLDRLSQVVEAVAPLARRHVGYGVQAQHYDAVGEALLWTLATGLKEHFTPQAKTAWAKAYALVANAMKAAAYPTPVPQRAMP
jgi:hemoglobin-like flavoprotein